MALRINSSPCTASLINRMLPPVSPPLHGPQQHPLSPPLPGPGQHPLSSPHQGPSQPLSPPQAISPPLPGQGYNGPQPEVQADYNSHPSSEPMPPPIPLHSKPPSRATSFNYNNPSIYWKPHFTPDIPVSHEFEHKQGHGDPWGWGNNELQNYSSDIGNSFHTPDGKLVLKAISAPNHPNGEARFTSARLVSRATLGKRDGCLTAWLTLPCAEGIWPAFWLLPREPFVWPHEGEVDIAESWNGDCQNHSCLHWGFYNGEDARKHLVRGTHIPDMPTRTIRFDFVWQCSRAGVQTDGKSAGGGRLMWYIDERPVMKNLMPAGTRSIEDWTILLNIAMGGNVCQGKQPREGSYDMIVHGLQMSEMPDGGWGKFDLDWQHCVDGAIM
ncbi:concanavalin A-like lectin/glucanase domain-containing protein [Xylariaceae sp. FL1019]|nr:concanavalin A-like lectin/glucanase domain-containing protein [Xylariaceae sp. FL1019]